MNCDLCGHEYPDACGRYGCPNCFHEPDEKEKDMKPYADDDAPTRCDDCGANRNARDLDFISDPGERLAAGEEVPAGQCPDCGATCYLVKEDKKIDAEKALKFAGLVIRRLQDYTDEDDSTSVLDIIEADAARLGIK